MGNQAEVSGPDYEVSEPHASSLIEALRAVGYSLPTAIADLVDNSITAAARNIWMTFHWNGADSTISLLDDGHGMTAKELSEAMRPGSRNPLDVRDAADLGRFGLGLKTASFSQARRLTVASKRKSGPVTVRRWDLDYVQQTGEWRLLKEAAGGSADRLKSLDTVESGTLVLLEQLDRVVGDAKVDDARAQDRFLEAAEEADQHLGMVFHRYLARGKSGVSIFINGKAQRNRVKPWDPFLESHIATFSPSDAEKIRFHEREVSVKGFVLPHKDKLTEAEHQAGGGPAGWNAQQGFYIYRNDRLLVAGGWLDLGFTNEEHHKLARVRIAIPNSTDAAWSIDVKKSRARPPAALRPRLLEVANVVRKKARELYAHRGRVATGTSESLRRAWVSTTKNGRIHYHVDREHPLFKYTLDAGGPEQAKRIEALVRLLEATVPVQQIWLDTAEKAETHASPFENDAPAHARDVMMQLYHALRAQGLAPTLARQQLARMPPFDHLPALLGTLSELEDPE